MFPACATFIGLSAIFWIHSVTCFLTCIVAMIILPETQGKTLTELSQLYSEKSQSGKKMVIPKIVITDCNGIQKSKYLSNFKF